MSQPEQRSARVFSNTLTELAFILFFVLLLVAVAQIRSYRLSLRTVSTHNAQLEERLASVEAERERLEQEQQRLAEEQRDVERAVAQLQVRLEAGSTEDFHRLLARQGQVSRLREEIDSLRTELSETTDELRVAREFRESPLEAERRCAELERAQSRCEEEKDHLEYRLGRGGQDYPPCWIAQGAEQGREEYLFDVVIEEEHLRLSPGWPPHRAADARALPGIDSLLEQALTLHQFRERARPLFEQSVERGCRHYVRIRDRTRSKHGFKSQLLAVEGYFYKYLEREGGQP